MQRALLFALALAVAAPAEGRDLRALAAPRRTVIKPDANTVAHVYWNGTALVDAKGNAWTMQGTVPQVAKAPPVPAGAGAFAAANHYFLGTGSDALDFAGDFTCRVIFKPTTATSWPNILANGTLGAAGWTLEIRGDNLAARFGTGTQTIGDSPTAAVLSAVNVVSFGRNGALASVKMNGGAAASGATGGPATSADVARIGCKSDTGSALDGVVYEVQCSTTAFDDASEAVVHALVRAKLGISAW